MALTSNIEFDTAGSDKIGLQANADSTFTIWFNAQNAGQVNIALTAAEALKMTQKLSQLVQVVALINKP